MMNRITEKSPRFVARITGLFYLLTILAGIFAQGFVAEKLIVFGDAAATAANILTHRSLFQLGFTVYLIEMTCQIIMTGLFYVLLKPVNSIVSLLSALIGVAGCVIKIMARLFYIAPLFVLEGAPYSNAFNPAQLQALALLLLKVNDQGAAIALAIFGFSTLLKGFLIVRSTFLPRILGVIGILAGLGWLTFLWPPLGYRLFPIIAAVGLLGSVAQIVWLLVFGVNEQRWREQVSATAASIWR